MISKSEGASACLYVGYNEQDVGVGRNMRAGILAYTHLIEKIIQRRKRKRNHYDSALCLAEAGTCNLRAVLVC